MSILNKTNMTDPVPNSWHRLMGQAMYAIDFDFVEYNPLPNGSFELLALIDAKKGDSANPHPINMKWSPMQLQYWFATKESIPFFILVSFLHESIPMVFMVPANEKAQQFHYQNYYQIDSAPLHHNGAWLTPYQFSKFLHLLHKVEFQEDAQFHTVLKTCSDLRDSLGLKSNYLKDLPNHYVEYPLPRITL